MCAGKSVQYLWGDDGASDSPPERLCAPVYTSRLLEWRSCSSRTRRCCHRRRPTARRGVRRCRRATSMSGSPSSSAASRASTPTSTPATPGAPPPRSRWRVLPRRRPRLVPRLVPPSPRLPRTPPSRLPRASLARLLTRLGRRRDVASLGIERLVNSTFKHMMYFMIEFGLTPSQDDLRPLQPVIDSLMRRDLVRYGPSTSGRTAGSARAEEEEAEAAGDLNEFLSSLPALPTCPPPNSHRLREVHRSPRDAAT